MKAFLIFQSFIDSLGGMALLFGCGKVEQFWADQDLDLLFKYIDLTPGQLNEDALGRALEKLAEVDMKELLSPASLALLKIGAAIQEQGLPVFSELLAGKKPDAEWNREAVLEMKSISAHLRM